MRLRDRIGIRIKEIRKARGLTQEAIAGSMGLSVDTVSLVERGKISPSLDTLEAFAIGLEIRLPDLLDFGDRPTKDAEKLALETAAIDTVRRMSKGLLLVAVRQLDALASLKN